MPAARTIIVDVANVMGSVPDGWWRDRAGAAARLRDRIALAGPDRLGGDLILVVEGAARNVGGAPGLRVVAATRSGDDTIVDLVASGAGERVVVTADRELRVRVAALGAAVVGPGTFLRRLDSITPGSGGGRGVRPLYS